MWYCVIDGQTKGPISEAELDSLVAQGKLGQDTYVFREGMTDWQPYSVARQPKPGLRLHKTTTAPEAAMVVQEDGTQAPASELAAQAAGAYLRKAKIESFTAWGTVAGVLVCMFIFLGLLNAHQPDAGGRSRNSARQRGQSAANRPTSPKPATGPQDMDNLEADVWLKGSTLTVKNTSDFDWPTTTIGCVKEGQTYLHQINGLRREETASMNIRLFKSKDGKRLGLLTTIPKKFDFELSGLGRTSVDFKERR
jgi:hypothetical protein